MTSTSVRAEPKKSNTSFYKRTLPNSCIGFSTLLGKEIFKSALVHNGLKSFYSLIQQFSTQTEPSFCGLTTLVLVLNALSVDPKQIWKGPWRWYSEEMLNCCVPLEEIQQSGITFQDFRCLAKCQGLTVKYAYADDNKAGLMKFRSAVKQACIDTEASLTPMVDEEKKNIYLVVTYSRKVLQQTGSGHFSPIAAYDPVSDQVLILDTARFKYGAHWTKIELLYNAMVPVDKDTGKSRGYFLLSFHPTSKGASEERMVQPISLLFSSKLSQSKARLKYKSYLNSIEQEQEVTWEQVLEYWTNNIHCKSLSVWDILEPLSDSHEDSDSKSTVQLLIQLIHDLTMYEFMMPSSSFNDFPDWNHHHAALLLVYLASICVTSRISILEHFPQTNNHSQLTKEQLLNEAALIETAIQTSDENDLCKCIKCLGDNCCMK